MTTLFGDLDVARGAVLSECGKYRYCLTRIWDDQLPSAYFIGLNPSTADAMVDDPTIRRMVGFARAWGLGGIDVRNLFAYRATDPRIFTYHDFNGDAIGPENYRWLEMLAHRGDGPVIAAWGTHGSLQDRGRKVAEMLRDYGVGLQCLKLTKDGHPQHVLYLRGDLRPVPFGVKDHA